MGKTISVPEEVLARAMRAAGTEPATDTVVKGLEEYTQRHGQKDLVRVLGTFDNFMTHEELAASRKAE